MIMPFVLLEQMTHSRVHEHDGLAASLIQSLTYRSCAIDAEVKRITADVDPADLSMTVQNNSSMWCTR